MTTLEERLTEAIAIYRDFIEDEPPSEDDFEDEYEFDVAITEWDRQFGASTEVLEQTLAEARATNPPEGSHLEPLIVEAEALLAGEDIPEQHAGRNRRKTRKGKKGKKGKKKKSKKAKKTRRRLV